MPLDQRVEATLFYKAGPVKRAALGKLLGAGEAELEAALRALQARLEGGATALVLTAEEAALALKPEFDELVEGMRKEELRRDIGKAGAETLAIVLYRAPVSRSEIDRIRGVNSSYIVRALEARGLIERRQGGRQQEYAPTTELLRHLGVREKSELPDYTGVMNALEAFERAAEEVSLTA